VVEQATDDSCVVVMIHVQFLQREGLCADRAGVPLLVQQRDERAMVQPVPVLPRVGEFLLSLLLVAGAAVGERLLPVRAVTPLSLLQVSLPLAVGATLLVVSPLRDLLGATVDTGEPAEPAGLGRVRHGTLPGRSYDSCA
jgi:hypothetical protein